MKISNYYFSLFFVIICWVSVYAVLETFSLWHYWGVPTMNFLFPDLHTLLSAIDAHFNGINVFKENPLCYFKIPHAYSNAWFIFHYVGITDEYRIFIAVFLITMFAISIGFLIKDKIWVCFPFLCSPAVLFAIERCNSDIVVFILIFVCYKLCLCKDRKSYFLGHLILFFAVALKYYPIAFSVVLLFRKEEIIFRLFHFLFQIILFSLWIYYCWDNLLIQRAFIPDPGYFSSFGFSPFVSVIKNFSGLSNAVCMIILIAFTILLVLKIFRTYNYKDKKDFICISSDRLSEVLCAGSLSIILFCYFVKTSFDYRLIFLFFTFPFILKFKIINCKNLKCFFISPHFFMFCSIITAWFEFIIKWITIITKELEIESFLPHILFLIRTSEVFLNHYLIILSLSITLFICYRNLLIKDKVLKY